MQLTGSQRYQLGSLPALEAHVQEQVSKATYSPEANVTILRMYAIMPQYTKVDVVVRILLKALQQLPSHHFKACLLLLTESMQAEESVARVVAVAAALEATDFPRCWSLLSSSRDLLSAVPGVEAAVRKYVLYVVGNTYKRISKRVLGASLNLQGSELDSLVAQHVKASGWQVSGELVTLLVNSMNNPAASQVSQEAIRFDMVAPVLQCVTVGF